MENSEIADRLDAFAALLELGDANPYTARAYSRAAETIRGTPSPVADLVSSGVFASYGGSARGSRRGCASSSRPARSRSSQSSSAISHPISSALAAIWGSTAKRSVELARALGVRTADELRAAAADGRLRAVPGVGPKTEARLLEALAREGEPRPGRGLLLNRAQELLGGISAALGGEAAGDVRRWRDSCELLAVVSAAADPRPLLARFIELPQIVAVLEQDERRALGVTVDGVPVELVVAEPKRFGTALVRATGSSAYVAALEPLPDAPDEPAVYRALDLPWCPPELREEPFRGAPPALLELTDIRGDLHCHTTWSDGRASVEEMGRSARERGYEYLAICDHTPAVGAVRGLSPDDVRRQGEEIAAANEALAPFRVLRGIECDILRTGGSTFPTTSSRSSTGYRRACTAASECRAGK